MRIDGRNIIKKLLYRKSNRIPIYSGFASKSEADSDRGDIRMFEIGISSQQYGNYEQSTGVAAQEVEGERLIRIAKEHSLFVEKKDWDSFGERKRKPSGESIVFLSFDGSKVTKLRSPFAKSVIKHIHAQDAIYEHLIHNILFPTTRYQFKGVSKDTAGVRIVLEQKYLPDIYTIPTQDMIDYYLINGLGLAKENRYYYGNDYLSITDVAAESDNVLIDGCNLYFIDPIIKLKRPAQKVLDYYGKLLM